jgi:hypothetical protein
MQWLFLSLEGWWVLAKPAVARPTGALPTNENTIADIFLNREPTLENAKLVEVKHRRFDFTDAASFPFDTLHLDRVNKPRRADYFFIVNRAMSHAGVVIAGKVRLGMERVYDKSKCEAVRGRAVD